MLNLPPGHWMPSDSNEWVFDCCPSCGKDNRFSMNLLSFRAHCFSCKFSVVGYKKCMDLVGKGADFSSTYKSKMREAVGAHRIASARPEMSALPSTAHSYLEGRHARLEQFGWNSKDRELVVEIHPWSPEFPSEILRRKILQEGSKWIPRQGVNTLRYGYGLRDHTANHILFVEGVFDVLTPQLEGVAVSTLGTNFSEDAAAWAFSKMPKRVGVWYDPDEAGIRGSEKACKRLTNYGLNVTVYLPKEVSFEGPYNERVDITSEPGDLDPDDKIISRIRKEAFDA